MANHESGSFEQYLEKFRFNFFFYMVYPDDDGTYDQILDLCTTDIEEANISNWFDSEEEFNKQYENIKKNMCFYRIINWHCR